MEGLDDDEGLWFVPEGVGQKKKNQPAAFHARRGGDAGSWNPVSGGVGGPLRRAAAGRAQATHEVAVNEAITARNHSMHCIERTLLKHSNVSPHSFLWLQRLPLQVAGLQVSFPFPPYPCQLTFMETAINALQV
jgi:hypothetical protein